MCHYIFWCAYLKGVRENTDWFLWAIGAMAGVEA